MLARRRSTVRDLRRDNRSVLLSALYFDQPCSRLDLSEATGLSAASVSNVIRELIEFPDDMVLTEIPSGRMITFKLQLRRGDVGRVIGRSGQTIHAIRALLASSAARHGQRAVLEIVE